jgi:ribosomal protein S8
MEEYDIAMKEIADARTLKNLTALMVKGYIKHVDIHTKTGRIGTFIQFETKANRQRIKHLETVSFPLMVMYFDPYKLLYPDIGIFHNEIEF